MKHLRPDDLRILTDRGIGLIEVLVALALTTVAFTLSMMISSGGYARSVTLRHRLQANLSASYVANTLYYTELTDPQLSPGTHTIRCSETSCPHSDGKYTTSWTVTPDTPSPGLMQIEISVEWNEQGVSRTNRTVIYRRAL